MAMPTLQLLSLVVVRTLLSGALLGAVVVSLLAWWTLETWLPMGLTAEGSHRLASHYEVAFMAGAVVASAGALRLARFDQLLRPMGPLVRVGSEVLCLWTGAVLACAPLLMVAHHFRTWQIEEFATSRSLPALGASLAHLCALLAFALRLPRPRGALGPVAVVLAATLLLPGLIAGTHPVSKLALGLLDVSAPLRASFDFHAGHAPWSRGGAWMMGTLEAVGWSLCAAAFAASPGLPRVTRNLHALRDPR